MLDFYNLEIKQKNNQGTSTQQMSFLWRKIHLFLFQCYKLFFWVCPDCFKKIKWPLYGFPSSPPLLLGVNLQTCRVNRKAWVGILVLYLNKYLSEAPTPPPVPTVVYGTSRIRERMGCDREWQFIPSSPLTDMSHSLMTLLCSLSLHLICVSVKPAAAHTTGCRQQS